MLTPNVVPDLDLEPWTHAMESLEAAIAATERIERSLDHDEARELGAEIWRHLANVKGKSREYRNALVTEHDVRLLLHRAYDSFQEERPIPPKLGELIADFLKTRLGVSV